MSIEMINLVLTAIEKQDLDSFEKLSDWLEENGEATAWNGESWDLGHGLRLFYEYEGDNDPERDTDDVSFNVIGYHFEGDESSFALEITKEVR